MEKISRKPDLSLAQMFFHGPLSATALIFISLLLWQKTELKMTFVVKRPRTCHPIPEKRKSRLKFSTLARAMKIHMWVSVLGEREG